MKSTRFPDILCVNDLLTARKLLCEFGHVVVEKFMSTPICRLDVAGSCLGFIAI